MSKLSVVFGSGRSAELMARMLSGSGNRVTVVGDRSSSESNIRTELKKDVEKDIPFMFPDDLRNQQDVFDSRLSRISFVKDFTNIEGEVELLIDTNGDDTQMLVEARRQFPIAPIASFNQFKMMDPFHVGIKSYEPLEITKIIEIHSLPTTDKRVLDKLRKMFEKTGITEVSPSEGILASVLISDWQQTVAPASSLQQEVQTLIGAHDTDVAARSHTVMH